MTEYCYDEEQVKTILDALECAKEALERFVWQPIDRAPIGISVLVYWQGGRMAVASYTGRDDVVWNTPLWEVECEPERFPPVCWMPLPEPPEGV